MKDEPSMLDTVTSIAIGVAAFGACVVFRWALEAYGTRARVHPQRCICPKHRRRDPKLAGLGKRRMEHG